MVKKLFFRLLPAAFALSLFFLVVGVHWAALDRFGSDIPNWDQWDAEGVYLLAPWFAHDHFAQQLFHPHNEHRVVVTKLHNLALTLLDGQWDARLECVTNALLHAALAVGFWLAGRRWLRSEIQCGAGFTPAMAGVNPALQCKRSTLVGIQSAVFLSLAALFALPLAWQNVLGGFHSQQYWLLLLSFIAIVALPFARTWSARWWGAALAAAVALLTMGSGFFASAMVFAVVAFRWLRRETSLREAWPTLALTLVLVVVGWFTRVEVDYHAGLKAKSAQDFLLSVVHSLQWPAPRDYTWLALVLWLPWLLVVGRVLRKKTESRAALTLAALGGWVFAQILATAYARGVGGDYPASRYMDTLGFGMAVNALALAWLMKKPETKDERPTEAITIAAERRSRGPGPWSLLSGLFALSWFGVFAWGVYDLAQLAITVEMPDVKTFYVKAEAHMRGFLVTNDPAQLAFDDIPYPDAGSLIDRINRTHLRALMPVSIRPPLPLTPATPNTAFTENLASQLRLETAPRHGLSLATAPLASLPTWGSFSANGTAATGEWMSAPLTAPLGGWLKFETAGDLGRDGVALELHDATSHALLATVQPTKIPGDTWRAAYVRAPHAPFVVVARDDSALHWLAFSAPVEMGNLSYVAWQLAKNGMLVAELAAGAAVLLGLAALIVGRARYP